MKNLTADIKRMMSSLAFQDASEYMTRKDKMQVLGVPDSLQQKIQPPTTSVKAKKEPQKFETVVLFNGQISESLVNYLLNSAVMEKADVHILAYGDAENLTEQTDRLSQQLKQAGKKTTVTQIMGTVSIRLFSKFVELHKSLRYVLAVDKDELAQDIISHSAHRYTRFVPVILIQD